MILITVLILLSYIACIIATESVLINTDDKVVYVESNTVYQFTKESNPSTGCSWVIKNQDEIDSSDLVEYIGSTYESDCESKDIDGCGGEETFSFRIGEIKESDELPEIHMVYGHNWAIETEFYDTVDLVLKVKKSENENGDEEDISDLPVVVYDKNTSDGNVMYVESNTIVQFTQGSNPSTGCSWVIKNQDEIDSSNLVKYIGSTYKSNCQDKRVGCGGEETFRFRIGDIQEGDELPEIHMVYGHSWAIETEFYEMFDLILKVKKSENEDEDEEDISDLPVVVYDKNASDDNVVYVESNTIVQFTQGSNPSTGCSWVIKNQDEIDSSNLVKYIGSTYKSNCQDKRVGCGGEETFRFRIGDIQEGDELPEIHMVYGHSWAIETEFYEMFDLVLKVKKSENEDEDEEDISDLPVVVYDKNTSDGNVMYVESNTIVQFTQGSNPSTGCSWVIKNQDEIDSSNLVKYIGSTYKSNCQDKRVGCGGEETFRFRIGDIQEGDELPEIHMVYGHSWAIETEFYEMFDLVLKVKKSENENEDEEDISDLPVIVYDKNASDDNVVYVESNTIVQFTQGSNPSTGCSWVIKNQDEIDNSNLVKYIGSTYKSNCQDKRVGCGGEETFSFRIGDIQEGDELPEIHMVYGHSWAIETEFYEMFDLVLKVKKSENENEDEEDISDLPVIVYDKNASDDNVVYVESNTIVQFTQGSNPSTGCSWVIKNQDEIDSSNLVKYIGSTYKSNCQDKRVGCGGEETFSFRIGDIQEGDELPEIHMVYGHSWAIETEFYEMFDLVLKVKKSEKEESCTFKGYPCCTEANPKVRYQDKDGDWGKENGKWCYINQEKQKENDEPKLIRTCTGENLGYPCCEKEHKNIYTDSDGKWAVENGQWCGLPTCTYTGDYPVCKTTTKVVYTDSQKWGVENQQWCVLCL